MTHVYRLAPRSWLEVHRLGMHCRLHRDGIRGPNEGGQLVGMTKASVEAGCKAFGFAEGSSVMLKIQTQKNTRMSHTGVMAGHFATVPEVLDWMQKDIHI